jgi:hypothetical protein
MALQAAVGSPPAAVEHHPSDWRALLLAARAGDIAPGLEGTITGSSMVGGSDAVATELEEVVDLTASAALVA